MKFTLKQLQAFIATAETHSITQAAHLMDISPPAISKHIKNLEDLYNKKLFSLSGKTLHLTNFGEQLFALVKPFIERAETVEQNILKIKQDESPPIKVLVTSAVLAVLSKKIMAFRKVYPHIDFELTTTQWKYQHEALNNSNYDLYVLSEPKSLAKCMASDVIAVSDMMLVAPAGHQYSDKSIGVEQLNEMTFMTTDDESASQGFQNQMFKEWKYKSNPLILDSYAAIKDCAIADVGVCMLPEIMVKEDISKGRLCQLQYPLNYSNYQVAIAYKRTLSEKMQLFYNYLLKHGL